MHKVTLADIAKELDLSVPTVHRSINNFGRVSEETRQRVLKKAAEMGYRTNLSASLLSSKRQSEVALVCPDNLFYHEIIKGFQALSTRFPSYGIQVDILSTERFDALQQTRLLESILSSGKKYAVVALPPAHPLLLNPLIEQLIADGAEVVTFDNDAPDSGRKLFIGPNGYVAGKVCAQLYNSILPAGATVALMPSFVTAIGLKERLRGFVEVCREHGRLKLLGPYEFTDVEEDGYSVCRHLLTTLKPDAIYTNSMMGNLGCCRALVDTGNAGKVFFIGYDLNEQIKGYIEQGVLYATLFQQPFMQGAYLSNVVSRICLTNNEQPFENIYMNTSIILKSNLEECASNLPYQLEL